MEVNMSKCASCNKDMGFFGGDEAFKCNNCGKHICKNCAVINSWGGIFGDKHMSVKCPVCDNTEQVR